MSPIENVPVRKSKGSDKGFTTPNNEYCRSRAVRLGPTNFRNKPTEIGPRRRPSTKKVENVEIMQYCIKKVDWVGRDLANKSIKF